MKSILASDYAKNFLWNASTGAGFAAGVLLVAKFVLPGSISVRTK